MFKSKWPDSFVLVDHRSLPRFPGLDQGTFTRRLDPACVHRVRMPSLASRREYKDSPCQDAFLLDEHGVFCLRRDHFP